jgi:hypothetical protein
MFLQPTNKFNAESVSNFYGQRTIVIEKAENPYYFKGKIAWNLKKLGLPHILLAFGGFLLVSGLIPVLRSKADLQARPGITITRESFAELLRIHAVDSLPDYDGHYFLSAGTCENCHGHDPNGIALVDSNGNDINMVDDWRATMMALSAKDPFWKAQVSHEGLMNPGHKSALEDKCLSCHAPLGRYTHFFDSNGQADYSMAMLENDTLGLDGVSCMSCHSQRSDSFGISFSGQLFLDSARTIWGQYPGPVVAPMFTSHHLVVAYGPHIQESKVCADCHTLITESVDLQGQYTGSEFVEQATYHEWLNSDYPNGDISCQGCHMPRYDDGVLLSGPDISQINPRRPYSKHFFVGSNAFMLKMMKSYTDSLDIEATAAHFDSTIARTQRSLRDGLSMTLTQTSVAADTVKYDLSLLNRAGHKFPSGYPSRRIFVEFVVRKGNGDTLFQSGVLGSNYEVKGQDPGYEPHHNIINDPGQAQIYEFIMGDVNGNVTTTLERAVTHIKDNRLVPQGFSSSHPNYTDTTEIAGGAETDPDFNHDGLVEGTGGDIVHYHVPLNGYTGTLQVSARVWYQVVRPGWLDETFANSSPDIDRFERWYNSSDRSVDLVAELLTQDVIIGNQPFTEPTLTLYPNPTANGWVNVLLPVSTDRTQIRVYDMRGRMVMPEVSVMGSVQKIQLPEAAGNYLLDFQGNGWRKAIKVVRR